MCMNPNAKIGSEDYESKNPALKLLQKLGYTYLSPEECKEQRKSGYHVLLEGILKEQLEKINDFEFANEQYKFSNKNIQKAIQALELPIIDGILKTSESIFNLLMYGKSFPETLKDGRSLEFNLNYIDWETPENNVFHVTEEFAVESADKQHNTRPDIVLFINGIPFSVIECKAPEISVWQGVSQTLRNQHEEHIPHLYIYTQLLFSMNKDNVRYATTGTSDKFWSVWKEEDGHFLNCLFQSFFENKTPTEQDKVIISMLSKERVLEFIRFFTIYDANIKKVARYQQYFAIKEILNTIKQTDEYGNRKGGVIWHTQGSGKSLTMVMLAKYIFHEFKDYKPKVILVTDRKELDKQITKTFAHTKLSPARATSGKNLVDLLKSNKADVVTTLINKFDTVEKENVTIQDRDVFILVDESHRTNYGELATKMRIVFPNACYIGFTGTPLMKKQKNTMSKFGGLIHKYTIKDGIDDRAIVPLIYEGRFVEQSVDEENIDLWFEQKTKRLNEKQVNDLKSKWSRLKRLTSTDVRIRRIALDINSHYNNQLKGTPFKAILATNYKRDAVRYFEFFKEMGDLTSAVVISAPDTRESFTNIDELPDDKVIRFWSSMMRDYNNEEDYEDRIKDDFLAGDIDILIVCGKLLTGFDAPLCQVLYIDKELKEHGLLQAIARTNRVYEGKENGLIIDYRGLIDKLDTAMEMYSGAGLENFEGKDLSGVLIDVVSYIGNLRESYSQLKDIFASLKNINDKESVEIFLADEKTRNQFYNMLSIFGRTLSVVLNSETAYIAVPSKELEEYKRSFVYFSAIRRNIKIRYFDTIDNKEYESQMQNLLDAHLSVASLHKITEPVDIMNVDSFEIEIDSLDTDRAKADAIISRLSKNISQNFDKNPAYYTKFSELIKETLKLYKEKIINDKQEYIQIRQILDKYRMEDIGLSYPEEIKSNSNAQAFYGIIMENFSTIEKFKDNTGLFLTFAIQITKILDSNCKIDWHSNKDIYNRIKNEIEIVFYDLSEKYCFEIDYNFFDKLFDELLITAKMRY